MKVLGLILEINPFHNGHKYFIDEAIKQDNYDYVIAIISTSFCMRGEVSVIDKFTKTSLLLDNKIDLVLELPVQKAINSSDYFTFSTVEALIKMGVTDITFGTECSTLEALLALSGLLETPIYNNAIKTYLDKGLSYSASSINALRDLKVNEELITQFTLPNNTLAIGYIKAIMKLNETIRIHNVKRIDNNYYDELAPSTSIASALSLRNLINLNESIDYFIPSYNYDFVKIEKANEKLYELLKYNFITRDINEFKNISIVTEGIENRMNSFINSSSYNEFLNNVQTKRYSLSRVKRTILQIVLNNTNNVSSNNSYLRLLGMSDKGKKYLSTLDKELKSTIISNIKNIKDNEILNMELRASKLYDLITGKNTYLTEFKTPIKKETSND